MSDAERIPPYDPSESEPRWQGRGEAEIGPAADVSLNLVTAGELAYLGEHPERVRRWRGPGRC